MARAPKDPTKFIYKGPTGQILSVALSDDNSLVAATDAKGRVTLWAQGDATPKWSVSISRSSGVAVGFDRDRVTATEVHGGVFSLALDSGRVVQSTNEVPTVNGFDVLEARDGRVVFRGVAPGGRWCVSALDAASFEPAWQRETQELFAGVGDGALFLADRVDVNPERWALRAIDLATGKERSVRSSGGQRVLAVHEPTGRAIVSDTRGAQLRTLDALDAEAPVIASVMAGTVPARFSPDGRFVALASGNSVSFIDFETGVVTPSTTRHTSALSSLRWARDSATLLSGGWDRVVRVHAAPIRA